MNELHEITKEQEIIQQIKDVVIESLPDAMVVVDLEGKIWLVNLATVKFFHYTRDEMFHKEVEMLLPERFRDTHRTYRKNFWKDPRTREMGLLGRPLIGSTKEGEEFEANIMLSWFETKSMGLFAIAIIRKKLERSSDVPSSRV